MALGLDDVKKRSRQRAKQSLTTIPANAQTQGDESHIEQKVQKIEVKVAGEDVKPLENSSTQILKGPQENLYQQEESAQRPWEDDLQLYTRTARAQKAVQKARMIVKNNDEQAKVFLSRALEQDKVLTIKESQDELQESVEPESAPFWAMKSKSIIKQMKELFLNH